MKKVKVMSYNNDLDLENEINKFLAELDEKKSRVEEIKFSTSCLDHAFMMSAMVIYEE